MSSLSEEERDELGDKLAEDIVVAENEDCNMFICVEEGESGGLVLSVKVPEELLLKAWSMVVK